MHFIETSSCVAALEQRNYEHFVIYYRDERQVVTVEIATDALPATVVLHSTLRRVHERVLHVRKRNAALLHSYSPVMLIDFPSVCSRVGPYKLEHCCSVMPNHGHRLD
jgi:hypothetical protein